MTGDHSHRIRLSGSEHCGWIALELANRKGLHTVPTLCGHHGPENQFRLNERTQKEAVRTLVIRHIPDAVVERLEQLAQRAGDAA
jgi:hypothetical protein